MISCHLKWKTLVCGWRFHSNQIGITKQYSLRNNIKGKQEFIKTTERVYNDEKDRYKQTRQLVQINNYYITLSVCLCMQPPKYYFEVRDTLIIINVHTHTNTPNTNYSSEISILRKFKINTATDLHTHFIFIKQTLVPSPIHFHKYYL